MQKLSVTHARNWQENRRRVGMGHVCQGRYKAFPVGTDDYFYQVVRYVERNALRSHLVATADALQWSSLWRRTHGSSAQRKILSEWPLPRPRKWLEHINEAQTKAEVKAIRSCVNRGQPYGSESWIRKVAKQLGLDSTMRRRGRPNNARPNSQY